MLTHLSIRNYAIIAELEIEFSNGLTIITGETGAGKSILLGALGLALGRRAESKMVTDSNAKCIVEATFTLEDDSLKEMMEAESLDFDREIICRRELATGGKGRSFINDTPVSLKTMQDITGHLIELHQQHDNLALQSKDYQLNVLDSISSAKTALSVYQKAYAAWNKARNELEAQKKQEQTSLRKKEFLQFQLDELSQAKLTSGEIAGLEESQRMLEHAEAIESVIHQLQHVLQSGPHSVDYNLMGIVKQVNGVVNVFAPFEEISKRLDAVRTEVQDIALEANRMEGPGGNDPAKLGRISSRLTVLYSLIKKYQCKDEEQLIQLYQSIKAELDSLSSAHEIIQALESKIAGFYEDVLKAAKTLTGKRATGAKSFIPKVIDLLHELGMPNARAEVEILPLSGPVPSGMDDVQFTFSANKGMSLQPLQAVASGGELSRLSLAIKSIYAKQAALPTIIFDEIDTGISGEVAWRMGQIIRSMAKGHQILMITHSPQIAAHAEQQYHVSKITAGKKDISAITLLSSAQRINEIAKMLSGDPPSSAAVKNAESLISSVSKK